MDESQLIQAFHIALIVYNQKQGLVISTEEEEKLEKWRGESSLNEIFYQQLHDDTHLGETLFELEKKDCVKNVDNIFYKIEKQKPSSHHAMFRWIKVAAILIITLAIPGWIIYRTTHTNNADDKKIAQSTPPKTNPTMSHDVLFGPAGNYRTISNTKNGVIVKQQGLIVSQVNGTLVLSKNAEAGKEIDTTINTLSVPKGTIYSVVLTDGTKVWLNSASSISFPATFTGSKRNVTIQGEAYFEVTKSIDHPFVVHCNNIDVQVLGTKFNVMGYTEENAIKTTLLEGAVKLASPKTSVTIKPGQQASIIDGESNFAVEPVDVNAAIAWQKGEFLFRNTSIEVIMRQVTRWYDVKIKYGEGNFSNVLFSGSLARKENLQQLIELLEADHRLKISSNDNSLVVLLKKPNK